jgi:hypothetical protein
MHSSSRPDVATIQLFKGAGLLSVHLESCDALALRPAPSKRGVVTFFSPASRRRMLDLLAKVDFKQNPLFVGLTYPDHFPLYSAQYKRDLDVLFHRMERRWPGSSAIWKLEFMPRRSGVNKGKIAPHFHLLVFGVPWSFPYQAERGKNYLITSEERLDPDGDPCEWWTTQVYAGGAQVDDLADTQDNFIGWITRNWFDIVNSGDARHFRAGTSVKKLRSRKGAYAYTSKKTYLAKPEEVKNMQGKPGRFWGVFNRKCLPLGEHQCYRIQPGQAVQLRRIIRRYRRANTPPEKRRWLRKGSASNAAQGFSVESAESVIGCGRNRADTWCAGAGSSLATGPDQTQVAAP